MSTKSTLSIFLAVGFGGAFGTLFRYVINLQTLGYFFPLGTLLENLIGSFLLGCLTGWVVYSKLPDFIRNGFGVGFCGGFTTMSALAGEVFALLYHGKLLIVLIYLSISIFGGVLFAFGGFMLCKNLSLKRTRKKAGEVT